MNKNFIANIITGCFSIMILVSCESHEQKADDAFERVKEEKTTVRDSNINREQVMQIPEKKKIANKIANRNGEAGNGNLDECTKFKIETEKKITTNESTIKEIKGIPNANSKLLKKVIRLEKDNNDLRRQMEEYNLEVKVRWEKFKTKMDQDVNEINIELKDLVLNEKI